MDEGRIVEEQRLGRRIAFDGERLMARYEDLLDEEPPAPKRGWWSFVWRHLPAVTTSLLVALLMIVVLWPNVVITVPSGRVGVLWKRFNGFDIYCWCFVGRGTLLDPRELREEGLHIIGPWDRLFIYDLRLQSTSQTIQRHLQGRRERRPRR